MAAKYQLITELYRRTGVAVAKNPQAWQSFLSAACRNYKCRFDEQLLIYAQRPDAVAVAQLETWNKQFKRWVNKDSKGIAAVSYTHLDVYKRQKKGRRILSAALCLLMMVTALPMSAFAWTSEEGKSCTSSFGDYYVGSDGEMCIRDSGRGDAEDV